MSIEEIRAYRNAEPFEPFVLYLTDGRAIQVLAKLRLSFAPWGKVGIFEGSQFHLISPDEIQNAKRGVLRKP